MADIHNLKRRHERIIERIKESNISKENKALLLEFNDYLISEGIAFPFRPLISYSISKSTLSGNLKLKISIVASIVSPGLTIKYSSGISTLTSKNSLDFSPINPLKLGFMSCILKITKAMPKTSKITMRIINSFFILI